jgi:hypothetical protein
LKQITEKNYNGTITWTLIDSLWLFRLLKQ